MLSVVMLLRQHAVPAGIRNSLQTVALMASLVNNTLCVSFLVIAALVCEISAGVVQGGSQLVGSGKTVKAGVREIRGA
jgi:hypothetical protein